MKLEAGQTAVVTGAASGIGAALAARFADAGLNVVLADVDEDGLAATAAALEPKGIETVTVPTDVSKEEQVNALATAASQRFGAIHVVCNNAGVASQADPWLGPLSSWEWVMGVNFWGVVYGVRAFLPHLVISGGGHIVNTASMAGLMPGLAASYDASKHAVVALTENLYNAMRFAELGVGVSVLCPGWVSTGIFDAERNWPAELGDKPAPGIAQPVMDPHLRRAVAEGMTPAAVADHVASAIEGDRYWVLPHADWMEIAARRWETITEGVNPQPIEQLPGLPPYEDLIAEMRAALEGAAGG
jgi:NAD(P)-dependent dehydrogenase (short-subunit alcohol dehydrogenase family)